MMLPTLTDEQKKTFIALHDLSGDEDTAIATQEVAARLKILKSAAAAILRKLCDLGLVYSRPEEVQGRNDHTTKETFWRITAPAREHYLAIVAS